jgi:hypothetical protein
MYYRVHIDNFTLKVFEAKQMLVNNVSNQVLKKYVGKMCNIFWTFTANQMVAVTLLSFLLKIQNKNLWNFLTLKDPGGGGLRQPIGQDIACHFSQDHAMVTKIHDFIHKHPN